MTPRGFTEDQLAEQPTLEVLESLGWGIISAAEESFGPGGTLGRETPGEAVIVPRLEAALRRLDPGLPEEALASAVDQLTRDRSSMSPVAANREVWYPRPHHFPNGLAVPMSDDEEPCLRAGGPPASHRSLARAIAPSAPPSVCYSLGSISVG